VVAYTTPDAAPTAIFGAPGYSDENANMDRIGADPTVGITLPSWPVIAIGPAAA
jgi:hypothetical protein